MDGSFVDLINELIDQALEKSGFPNRGGVSLVTFRLLLTSVVPNCGGSYVDLKGVVTGLLLKFLWGSCERRFANLGAGLVIIFNRMTRLAFYAGVAIL
jgi:hypothetical protein